MPSENYLCVACGKAMRRSDGIAFRTDKYWRQRVARGLGYAYSFIQERPIQSRICREHFRPEDLNENGTKAIGLPCLHLKMLDHWPRWTDTSDEIATQLPGYLFSTNAELSAQFPIEEPAQPSPVVMMDVEELVSHEALDLADDLSDVENDEDERTEFTTDNQPNFCLVEIDQLVLLFRRCFECGSLVNRETICAGNVGSNICIRFYCAGCKKVRRWNSQSRAKSGHYNGNLQSTSAALLSAIPYSVSGNLKFQKLSNVFSHCVISARF